MTSHCPACHAVVSSDRLIIAAGIAVHDGQVVRLTPNEERILKRLRDGWPNVVQRDDLYQVICDAHVDEGSWPDIKIVDVVICKIRRKIRPLKLYIATTWGEGYMLRFDDPTANALKADRRKASVIAAGLDDEGTDELDERIRELVATNCKASYIAQVLGMTYAAVQGRLDAINGKGAVPVPA